MKVGLLGLQGAVQDHIPHLEKLNARAIIVKNREALDEVDRLIIPGGESTVMTMYLEKLGLREPLLERIRSGMPMWGICAGCILLADRVDDQPGTLRELDVTVKRNAYGRQIMSNVVPVDIPELGLRDFPAVYIRAPRIVETGSGITVLARREGDPVMVRQQHLLATTFHPELTEYSALHRYFLDIPVRKTVPING